MLGGLIAGLVFTINGATNVSSYLHAPPCPATAATASDCIHSIPAVITGTQTSGGGRAGPDYSANYRTVNGQSGEVDNTGPAFAQITQLARGTKIELLSWDGQVVQVRLPDGTTLGTGRSPLDNLRFGLRLLMLFFGLCLIIAILMIVLRSVGAIRRPRSFILFLLFLVAEGLLLALLPTAITYYVDPGSPVLALVVLGSVCALRVALPAVLPGHADSERRTQSLPGIFDQRSG
jgi:hypothetical protein